MQIVSFKQGRLFKTIVIIFLILAFVFLYFIKNLKNENIISNGGESFFPALLDYGSVG